MGKIIFVAWIEENVEPENKGVFGKILLTILKWLLLALAYILYWIIGGFYILIKSIIYKNKLWICLGAQYCIASIGLVLTANLLSPENFWSYFFGVWMLLNIITLILFIKKSDDLDLREENA